MTTLSTTRVNPHRLPPSADGRMRFTSDEYHRMIETGVLTEDDRVELLDGEIVFKSPFGRPHISITDKLTMHFAPKVAGKYICRVQGSIELTDVSEPEPDFLVLKHSEDFYFNRDAKIDEIALLVEVADSSLKKDLGRKREIYAKAGVAEYWVVDANGSKVVVHKQPTPDGSYSDTAELGANVTLTAVQLPDAGIDLTWLFKR